MRTANEKLSALIGRDLTDTDTGAKLLRMFATFLLVLFRGTDVSRARIAVDDVIDSVESR